MRLVNRTLDEIRPGDRAEVRRLISADDLYVFAVASGNYNPMHLTDSDLNHDGAKERVAPGMFVGSLISAVLGRSFPAPARSIAARRWSFTPAPMPAKKSSRPSRCSIRRTTARCACGPRSAAPPTAS